MSDPFSIMTALLPQLVFLLPNLFLLFAAIYFRKTTKLAGGLCIIIGVIFLIGLNISAAGMSLMYVTNSGADIIRIAATFGALNMLLAMTGTVLISIGLIISANQFKRAGKPGDTF